MDGFTTKMPNAALKHRHHGLNVFVFFCSLFLRVINTFNLLFHEFYSVFIYIDSLFMAATMTKMDQTPSKMQAVFVVVVGREIN